MGPPKTLSTTAAYAWELWRNSRWQLLSRVVIVGCMMGLLSSILQSADGPTRQLLRGLVLILLIPTNIFSPTWMGSYGIGHAGFSFRSGFIRPVTTVWLVMIPIAYAVIAGVAVYTAQVMLFWTLTGEALPVVWPSLIISVGIVCVLTAIWVPTTQAGRSIAIAICVAAISLAAYSFHNGRAASDTLLMAMGRADYLSVTWAEVAILGLSVLLGLVVTVLGVERQRHGDTWSFGFQPEPKQEPTQSQSLETKLLPAWSPSPRRRLLAQFGFEWQRCRSRMLAATLIFPALVFLAVTIGPLLGENWHGSEVIWIGVLAFCPFLYQMLGADATLAAKVKHGDYELSQFDLTRPLPSDQIMAIKTFTVFVFSLMGWLFMAIAIGLHSLTGQTQTWMEFAELVSQGGGNLPAQWWVVYGAGLLMIYISSTSILFSSLLLMARYPLVMPGITAAFFLHILLIMQGAKLDWNLQPLWTAYGYIGAVLVVAGSLYVLQRSIKSKTVGPPLLMVATCLWLLCVVSVVYTLSGTMLPVPIPTAAIVFGAACSLVPLAATVVSPLALASHRHT